mgnify:FL=1
METWLVSDRERARTVKRYTSDSRVWPVELAVIHWTASPMGDGPDGAAPQRIRTGLTGNARQSSTHFVILRDGSVLQAAPIEDRTWHAGGSTWIGLAGERVTDINRRSIGIDLECVGPLAYTRGCWRDDYGGRYEGPLPVADDDEHFEPYREAQILALLGLVPQIVAALPILCHSGRWVGHSDIRRTKIDPGPAFPWARLRAAVMESPCAS